MRTTKLLLIAAVLVILAGSYCAYSADTPPVAGIKPEVQSLVNDISVSPYYTVGFADFNGKATSGVGLDIGLGLSKSISVVSFVETSDTKENAVVDRFGGGIQMQGKLGRWLKPYGRFSVCYALDGSSGLSDNQIFLRPEFGADIDIYHYKSTAVSVRGAWMLDVDTDGRAAQRLKAGLNIKF